MRMAVGGEERGAQGQDDARPGELEAPRAHWTDEALRLLLDCNPIPAWVVDNATGDIVDVNEAACSQYGYAREAFLRLRAGDLRRARPASGTSGERPAGFAAEHSTIERHRGRGGFEIEVQVAERAFALAGRPTTLVLSEVLTARVRSERLTALQHAVTRLLAEAATISQVRATLLRVICEGLGWDVAELWEVDTVVGLLCGTELWARPDLDVTEFRRESLWCAQRPGGSLAGTAWSERRIMWAPRLQAAGVRERLSAAEALGMNASLAIPIEVGGTIIGVIQLYARAASEPETECLDALAALGSEIGQFLARKRSEHAHRETHQRLAALVADCPLAIMVFDVHGYVQMWNPAAERIFGWSELEVLARANPIVPLEQTQQSQQFRATVLRGERITGVQVQRQTKDRRLIDVSLSTAPIRGADGTVTGVMAIVQDITEEKAAERELIEAHEESERLLSAIASVLIGITAEGRISRWNSAASRTFTRSATDVFGRTLGECGIAWDHHALEQSVAACRHSQQPIALNDFRYTVDGRERFLNLVLNPVTAGREAGSVVLLASDVTDYRVLQSQLGQAQKLEAIGQLAAGIAHEINTPTQYVGDNVRFLRDSWPGLSAVLAQASGLESARADGTSLEDLADRLSAAATEADVEYLVKEIPVALDQTLEGVDRVSEIVRAMKEFSHPGVEEKTAVDLNRAVETTLSVARNEWKYVCEVVTHFASALPLVPCLAGEINQVILNLLVNAAHAIADATGAGRKGLITIHTRHVDEAVEISVTDTGTGIPEAIRSRIFDPFFTTKDVGRGTGQGLALTHNVVVNKHGGRIWFDTEVGKGTTFHVSLPLEQVAQLHP